MGGGGGGGVCFFGGRVFELVQFERDGGGEWLSKGTYKITALYVRVQYGKRAQVYILERIALECRL